MTTDAEHAQYRSALRAELAGFDERIESLTLRISQVESSDDETALTYQRYLDALEVKRKAIEIRLDQLDAAEGSLWDELQGGVEDIWNDFKLTFNRASEEFEAGQQIQADPLDNLDAAP